MSRKIIKKNNYFQVDMFFFAHRIFFLIKMKKINILHVSRLSIGTNRNKHYHSAS